MCYLTPFSMAKLEYKRDWKEVERTQTSIVAKAGDNGSFEVTITTEKSKSVQTDTKLSSKIPKWIRKWLRFIIIMNLIGGG